VWHEVPSRPEHDGQRSSGSPQYPSALLGFAVMAFDGFGSMVLPPPFPKKMLSSAPCGEGYSFSSRWKGCSKRRLFKLWSLSLEKVVHPNWTLHQMHRKPSERIRSPERPGL